MAQHSGRHRATDRFNPLTELTGIVAKSAQPAVKTSAVIAASGGLVASFALPAQAAPAKHAAGSSKDSVAAAPVAVKAPETVSPAATTAFGVIGFEATAKPKAQPKPAPAAQEGATRRIPTVASLEQVSRSVARAPVQTSTKPASSGVLEIAASLSGIMYYYGGTSPSTGFDCSGFTQYVFGKVGISLPRTAEQQRQFVTPVSDPRPGDLVFFGAPAYHMGIYAGNGKMWDSPRTGKAVALRDIWSSNIAYGRP